VRDGDDWVVNGQKTWTTLGQHADWIFCLVRTDPTAEKKQRGISLLVFPMDTPGVTLRPIQLIDGGHEVNEVFFEDVRVPAENLIGEEGEGFRYVLDGMNAERILIAAECTGDGRFFIDRATERAKEREVFGRPIGQNQGIQFPIARAYANIEAASLMVEKAAILFETGEPCGAEANVAKLLAADASWEAANAAVQTFGGYGFDADYDIERKFRETRLYQVAPISTNLILSYVAEHVLGLPRSF
jgi:acyl-CoA dehydrogenase